MQNMTQFNSWIFFYPNNVIYVHELICNTKTLQSGKLEKEFSIRKVKGYPFGSRPPLVSDFFRWKPRLHKASVRYVLVHIARHRTSSLPINWFTIFATSQLVYFLFQQPICLLSLLLANRLTIFATSQLVYDLRYQPVGFLSSLPLNWFTIFVTSQQDYNLRSQPIGLQSLLLANWFTIFAWFTTFAISQLVYDLRSQPVGLLSLLLAK